MGKDKPNPIKLQIRLEDLARLQVQVDFTPAKFNNYTITGFTEETSIVTTTGDYLITWNFAKIRKNLPTPY